MKNYYGSLLKPIKIGKLELKNRVCVSPMDFKLIYGNYQDSTLTKRIADVYRERAKGGAGLIFTGQVKCEQKLDPFPKSLEFAIMDRDERIKEFAWCADVVHLYGAKIMAELNIGSGRYADEIAEGEECTSASAVPNQYNSQIMARPLTVEEIHYLVDCYGKAAARTKKAGFDGVCVHAGWGYLIDQFLSPEWNLRTDEYGGTPEKRMRLLIECIESVKRYCGDDFPIVLSLLVDEKLNDITCGCLTTGELITKENVPRFKTEGITPEYAIEVAQRLENLGYVDAYHVRVGNYYNQDVAQPSAYSSNAEYAASFAKFKKGVTKPVIFDNRLSDPLEMQRMIETGETDMVSMGRAWIADADWVCKAQKDADEIRPCIRCCMCLENSWMGRYVACAVNPHFGHEADSLETTRNPKNIIVVGGGPGGMQAALTAAARGHRVTLIEKERRLGGRLYEAGAVSFKPETLRFANWMIEKLLKTDVKIELGVNATKSYVADKNPDAVIVATGAKTVVPPIPGIEQAVAFDDVMQNRVTVGQKVVVIGGGLIGCEIAYTLHEKGHDVAVVEMLPEICATTSVIYRHAAVKRFETAGFEIYTSTSVQQVNKGSVKLCNGQELMCDDVIFATGLKQDMKLFYEIDDVVDEVYVIGDAKEARKVFNATQEAYQIALAL